MQSIYAHRNAERKPGIALNNGNAPKRIDLLRTMHDGRAQPKTVLQPSVWINDIIFILDKLWMYCRSFIEFLCSAFCTSLQFDLPRAAGKTAPRRGCVCIIHKWKPSGWIRLMRSAEKPNNNTSTTVQFRFKSLIASIVVNNDDNLMFRSSVCTLCRPLPSTAVVCFVTTFFRSTRASTWISVETNFSRIIYCLNKSLRFASLTRSRAYSIFLSIIIVFFLLLLYGCISPIEHSFFVVAVGFLLFRQKSVAVAVVNKHLVIISDKA